MRQELCKNDRGNAVRGWFGRALLRFALFILLMAGAAYPAACQTVYDDEQYAEQTEDAPLAQTIEPARVVPMPRVTVYPNDTITEDMLIDRAYFGEGHGRAVFTTHEGLVGKVSKQTLLPNAPIAINAVRDPFAIKLGQAAVVIFKSGGLVISGTAVPLQAGSVGEVIALRNTDSNTTIRGVVQADGTVRVGP
jgi:flagellar basal body P-ring formation protein FlgA